MTKNPCIFKINIFQTILLLILFNFSFSQLLFNYPYAFRLINKNIFTIHQTGITICNENFTEIVSEVQTFSGSEQISTDEALSKIAYLYEDGYIICLINDKTYIFDDQGYLKFKSYEVITDSNVEYYSLVYTGKIEENNFLSFVIGFISQNKLAMDGLFLMLIFWWKLYMFQIIRRIKLINIISAL